MFKIVGKFWYATIVIDIRQAYNSKFEEVLVIIFGRAFLVCMCRGLDLIVCNVGMFTRRNISARDKWRGISINTTHLNSLHQIAATQFVVCTVTRKSESLNQHFYLWIVNQTLLEKEQHLDRHSFLLLSPIIFHVIFWIISTNWISFQGNWTP